MMDSAVPRVTEESKIRFPRAAEYLTELDGFLADYESRVRFRFTPENPANPELSVRDKVLLLLLSTTASARWVTWTMLDSLNRDMTPGIYLATRAHHELTGVLAYTLVNLRRQKTGELSEPDFHTLLNRLNLGRRHGVKDVGARDPRLKGHMEVIGVMTQIDAVDKVFAEPKMKGRFRDAYEWLSEFCHPNLFSRIALGHAPQGREIVFAKTPRMTEDNLVNAVGYGNVSHWIFFHCYDAIAAVIGGVPPQSD
jgi:hypothetical protein